MSREKKFYIETRPEWIEAIHKCIEEKWNIICSCHTSPVKECALCILKNKENRSCSICSLDRASNNCNDKGSDFYNWDEVTDGLYCEDCPLDDKGCHKYECPSTNAPDEAEAMLEALVNLLPPEERKRYGDDK